MARARVGLLRIGIYEYRRQYGQVDDFQAIAEVYRE
jgi:hypothetical protein